MNLIPLKDIFYIEYGNQFDLNKMVIAEKRGVDSVNFVSRSSKNLGIMACVGVIKDVKPYESGLITVTLGGTYLLSCFVQPEQFYTAQNIKVLRPKRKMSFEEKTYYCMAIRLNRFRYSSHGREANTTLDNILVPDNVPQDFYRKFNFDRHLKPAPLINKKYPLNTGSWEYFNIVDFFTIGASSDRLINKLTTGGKTPYITSSEINNGASAFIKEEGTNPGNTITANRGGSVGYFFYQPVSYQATPVDVRILYPKFDMNVYMGMFLKTILQKEKYRYNYSRKMGTAKLKQFRVLLPAKNNKPDWLFMERYIKSLPFSGNL